MPEIPFLIFVTFLAIAFMIGILGIIMGIRKIQGSPFITIFSGVLIFALLVLTSNISFSDTIGSSTTITTYKKDLLVNQSLGNVDATLFSGGNTKRAEYVNGTTETSSPLQGLNINTISLELKKVGSPTGNLIVGIQGSSAGTWAKAFGLMNASLLTTSYKFYNFSLPDAESFKLNSTHRITIQYDGNTGVIVHLNSLDVYPISLCQVATTTVWSNCSDSELTFKLYDSGFIEETLVNTPQKYAFNQNDVWAYMIFLSAMFIFVGVIFQIQRW